MLIILSVSCEEFSFAEENNSTVLVDDKGEQNNDQNSASNEKSYALCECTEVLAPDEVLSKLTPDAISKIKVSEIIPGTKKIFLSRQKS